MEIKYLLLQPPPADFGRKRRDVDGLEEYDDLVEAGRGFDGGCSNSCGGCNNTCGCDGDFTGRSSGFRYTAYKWALFDLTTLQ
jgi:hypothetical protein